MKCWISYFSLVLGVIAAHLCLFAIPIKSAQKSSDPVEISKWDNQWAKEWAIQWDRPIIFSQPSDSASDKKARYLSERRNRTDQETQSQLNGRFQSGRLGLAGEGSGLMSVGQSPNLIPDDIPRGSETVLSTDRYVYASFINRIADTIYQPWVDAIDLARETLAVLGKNVDANVYVTKIAVMLNPRGEVIGVQLMKGCGVDVFDDAPKKAFWEAEVFPHPPAAFFSESETLRLYYEFHLKLGNRFFEIFPRTI